MRLLLDTHVLLWAVEDSPRLKPAIRVQLVDQENEILFSMVSVWEAVIKIRVGKMHLDWRKLVPVALESGFRRIGVDLPHLEALAALPRHHRDPFDHMLVAQAIAERATLVTSHGFLADYPVEMIRA